jgi:hypothetical protein
MLTCPSVALRPRPPVTRRNIQGSADGSLATASTPGRVAVLASGFSSQPDDYLAFRYLELPIHGLKPCFVPRHETWVS